MGKQHAKKKNPRRIPLSKSSRDIDAIINTVSGEALYHAWLLTLTSMDSLGLLPPLEYIVPLWNVVQQSSRAEAEALRAHRPNLAGVSSERIDAIVGFAKAPVAPMSDNIHSQIELDAFARKVEKYSFARSMRLLCQGFVLSGRFSDDELRRVFFDVDLAVGEIEIGATAYDALDAHLKKLGISVSREGGVSVALPSCTT